jgi:hypothetical protein
VAVAARRTQFESRHPQQSNNKLHIPAYTKRGGAPVLLLVADGRNDDEPRLDGKKRYSNWDDIKIHQIDEIGRPPLL